MPDGIGDLVVILPVVLDKRLTQGSKGSSHILPAVYIAHDLVVSVIKELSACCSRI